MPCTPGLLKRVPLFSLLDDDELSVLAAQVEQKSFVARQRIYKMGDPAGQAYVVVSGSVKVTTIDQDHQEVDVDRPTSGQLFGFASMIDQTPHQTTAVALDDTICVEIDRKDIEVLLHRKPDAGMDLLEAVAKQFHAAHHLVRARSFRNPNQVIEEEATVGEHVADSVARFGGSWKFIISFLLALVIYSAVNVYLGRRAWDPYPFILLNLLLSMLAAIQAPVIMMSQNRQDTKDRLRSELDFAVNRQAETEIQGLAAKLHVIGEKIDDIDELLRRKQGSTHEFVH